MNLAMSANVPGAVLSSSAKSPGALSEASSTPNELRPCFPLSFMAANGRRTSEATRVRLQGGLELRLPLPDGPQVLVEGEKQPVFLVNDVFPAMPEEPRPLARSVVLFWDASESGARLDHGPTFRL